MKPEPDAMVNDRVRLIDRLAVGSMGDVWLAYHDTLRTEVAVKFISPEVAATMGDSATERFSLEASAAARIRSPHTVQNFDHGTTEDGTPYIVMELLEGDGLGSMLRGNRTLSIAQSATILQQVGRALDAAHALGIIHRDIKPDNIFLTQSHGEIFVKVFDFGVAKETSYMESGARQTAPGTLIGSPGFMSRDQVLNPDHVSHHMDLWALGAVVYKCLTGQLPFAGSDVGHICSAIAKGEFRPPSELRPELPPACDAWFARVFHRDAAERPATGAEMSASFAEATADLFPDSVRASLTPGPGEVIAPPARIPAPAPPSPPDPPIAAAPFSVEKRRRRWPWVLGGAVLLVGGGVTTFLLVRESEPPPDIAESAATKPSAPIASAAASAAAAAISAPPLPPVRPASQAIRAAAAALRKPVAAGEFWMGCHASADPLCTASEKPGRAVRLAAFRIDRTEVSVRAYARCVAAEVCTDKWLDRHTAEAGGALSASAECNWGKPGRDLHPINCVDYEQASTYCRWVGADLPTEAQWEKAARGNDKRIYPWAMQFATCTFAVMAQGPPGCRAAGTGIAGTKPAGASPYGVLNLAGNVREWTRDWYAADYYLKGAPASDPPGPARGEQRALRGGSFQDKTGRRMRASFREGASPRTRSIDLGFRCATDGS